MEAEREAEKGDSEDDIVPHTCMEWIDIKMKGFIENCKIVWNRLQKTSVTAKLKVILATLQIVTATPNTLEIQFPPAFTAWLNTFNIDIISKSFNFY